MTLFLAPILAGLIAAGGARADPDGPAPLAVTAGTELPSGFVDLAGIAPGIAVQMRYAGAQNFVGRPVSGYRAARCLLSRPAAAALAQVERDLAPRGLGLLVYDCYRPQRAVDDFVAWAHDPADTATRSRHYPAVPKAELFQRGYIALRSGHTRGSTVDLTLIRLAPPLIAAADRGANPAPSSEPPSQPLSERLSEPLSEPDDCRFPARAADSSDGTVDMGTTFDCFDQRAHADFPVLSRRAQRHRRLLRQAMVRRGFAPYAKEWWHFTLAGEPFPDRYFNFEVR